MRKTEKSVVVVPLHCANNAIQCKIVLRKEGCIMSGTETAPVERADQQARFAARKVQALVTVMLAVATNLLYIIGADSTVPAVVWRALSSKFQHKTWTNKLELIQKLFSLRLGRGAQCRTHYY